jgi:hypothetical protein
MENIMTLEEKCGYLWDYYKDCFGHRPRHFLPDFWANEAEVDAGIKRCDDWYDRMSSTAEGRKEMRADGWIVD